MNQYYFESLLQEAEHEKLVIDQHAFPKASSNMTEFGLLLWQCSQATDPLAFVLRLGQRITIANHGVISYALMNSGNLEEMTRLTCKYSTLMFPFLRIDLRFQDDQVMMVCRASPNCPDPVLFSAFAISIITAGKKSLVAGNITDTKIHLAISSQQQKLAAKLLGIEVVAHADYNGISFGREYFGLKIPNDNPMLAALAKNYCDETLQLLSRKSGVVERVRLIILNQGKFPKLEEVAQQLAMSERTLRRQLTKEQTSFKSITDEMRLAMAKRYLAESSLYIVHIAEILAYKDAASFRKRFKQLTGMTAHDWRQARGLSNS